MIDKYLEFEVGSRREITSSMVERADAARRYCVWPAGGGLFLPLQRDYNNLMAQRLWDYGLMAQNQMAQMAQGNRIGGQLGGLFSSALGGLLGGTAYQPSCPYCGR